MPRPASSPSPVIDPAGLAHLARVAAPALHLAPVDFVEEIAARLAEAGVQTAVRERNSATIYDRHLRPILSLQGLSNEVARGWDERHGGVRWTQVDEALRAGPTCPRLQSYWHFAGCGYRKGCGTCSEPSHLPLCPVPHLNARKGVLAQAGVSLWLFIRDVCGGDLVGWLDARLAMADPGRGAPDRGLRLGTAVSEPLTNVAGISHKVANLALVELLLSGDPNRERWVTAGASIVVVDSLTHSWLHRVGALRRCSAEHAYGPACYAPGGCASLLRAFAETVDARQFNPHFPAVFPRFIQFAAFHFCAAGGLGICNGNRIDDREACRLQFCPSAPDCDRVRLRPLETH